MSGICEKHGYDLRYVKECSGCVREERDRLRALIVAWCKDHKWCASAWKDEPTNKALFDEAGKVVE